MTIGAGQLLEDYGSPLGVAEAFILGKIDYYQEHVSEIVDKTILEAARIRLEARGLLNKKNIKSIPKTAR